MRPGYATDPTALVPSLQQTPYFLSGFSMQRPLLASDTCFHRRLWRCRRRADASPDCIRSIVCMHIAESEDRMKFRRPIFKLRNMLSHLVCSVVLGVEALSLHILSRTRRV
jgi:hypothetical protein